MMQYTLCVYLLVTFLCAIEMTMAWNGNSHWPTRRDALETGTISVLAFLPSTAVAAPAYDFPSLLEKVATAREQLTVVPKLIEEGKWDSVRAVLIEPPLADCWAKTARPLLSNYAEALGDAGGDELAALEAKEEAISHLRYLDMAVYNNVFNPITVSGTNGATQTLLRSYYEDPINEYKASAAALDELVKLSKEL